MDEEKKSKQANLFETISGKQETNMPERMCTLCDGNVKCVENCPFGALEYIEMPADRDLTKIAPAQIAEMLIEKLYNLKM